MLATGLLAGAAGTLALDLYTYLDIFVSGRAPSSLPATTVAKIAERTGLSALAGEEEAAANRRIGAGALLGYGVGIGGGVGYALLRPPCERWLPWPVAGLILGLSTLGISEGSSTALGATDWSKWTASEWLADVVPRAIYGLVVGYVCENLDEADEQDDAAA